MFESAFKRWDAYAKLRSAGVVSVQRTTEDTPHVPGDKAALRFPDGVVVVEATDEVVMWLLRYYFERLEGCGALDARRPAKWMGKDGRG